MARKTLKQLINKSLKRAIEEFKNPICTEAGCEEISHIELGRHPIYITTYVMAIEGQYIMNFEVTYGPRTLAHGTNYTIKQLKQARPLIVKAIVSQARTLRIATLNGMHNAQNLNITF